MRVIVGAEVMRVHPKDALGRSGEELAGRHLETQGIAVLERNWRCREGELDIVARDGDVLVACEVKTRSGVAFGSPFEAVTAVKLARLRRLAVRWIAARGSGWVREIRVDVIGIVHPAGGDPVVEHVRDVVP